MPATPPAAPLPINVLIADDRLVVREGLRRIVAQCRGARVVAEAASRDEVLAQVRATNPDVLLLDVFLDSPTILGLIRELKQRHPRCRALVLDVQGEDAAALRILEAGAVGYLSKDLSRAQVCEAIQQVARGLRYVSPVVAARLITDLRHRASGPRHRALSDREFQVLCMFGSGIPFKQIATDFGVSPKTVSTYRSRILAKLRLKSNADMIRYAIEHHLVRSANLAGSRRRKTPTDHLPEI